MPEEIGPEVAIAAEKLIVALDLADLGEARRLVRRLRPLVRWFKVGLELYSAHGPAALDMVKEEGGFLFVDLKLHDIPRTVARTTAVLVRRGADMLTLHAGGGARMLAEAVAAAREACPRPDPFPLLLGVTVLTSLERRDLIALGVRRKVESQVLALARLSLEAGLAGCVASPREVAGLRRRLGAGVVLVTPGIRPACSGEILPGSGWNRPEGEAEKEDQRRTATPAEALVAGADWLVVGRQIVGAADPEAATREILEEMRSALRPGARDVRR